MSDWDNGKDSGTVGRWDNGLDSGTVRRAAGELCVCVCEGV